MSILTFDNHRRPKKPSYLHILKQNYSTAGTFTLTCEAGKIPEEADLRSPQKCNLDVPEWLRERTTVLVQCFANLTLPKPTSGTWGQGRSICS